MVRRATRLIDQHDAIASHTDDANAMEKARGADDNINGPCGAVADSTWMAQRVGEQYLGLVQIQSNSTHRRQY